MASRHRISLQPLTKLVSNVPSILRCLSKRRRCKGKNMTKNLLVELGLEELPAYVVTPSEKQLGEKMAAFLRCV